MRGRSVDCHRCARPEGGDQEDPVFERCGNHIKAHKQIGRERRQRTKVEREERKTGRSTRRSEAQRKKSFHTQQVN